ncbi:MAG: hypothetical protein O2960_29980 [Verrucomicrobia bacterium]|jgi:hypothetical protein|nr:hypothetical protein [Verrucomicrobiota bacterium]
MNDLLKPITDFVAEQHAEAAAEKIGRNTPISYWCTLFDDCVYSPGDFYASVQKNIERRHVPDLLVDFVLMHEGMVFSKRRLYHQLRRERIVAEICAAPFGSGFFISSRLFDRRRRAFFWDYLFACSILAAVTIPVLYEYGTIVSIVVLGTVFTGLWSLMRLATEVSFAWLDEKICNVPWFGPIYETIFHPNTYFRQDQQSMYREAVNRSVQEAVAELTSEKGLKPLTDAEFRPVLPELR